MKSAFFEEKEYEAPLYNQLERDSPLLWSPEQVIEGALGFDHARFLENLVIWSHLGFARSLPGFGFGTLCRFTFEDEANRMISRDKSLFEDRLKILIVRAAQARIRDSGLFPYDNIADLTIVAPLEPQSSSSYSVRVDALMIGALLGVDKQRAAAIVNLDMEVDLNQLNSSDVRVRHVDVLGHKRLEGIEPGRAVDLLAKVL